MTTTIDGHETDVRIGWLLRRLTAAPTRVLIYPQSPSRPLWKIKVRRYREVTIKGETLLEILERALEAF